MGIWCAATLLADSDELVLWHGADRMNQEQAGELVQYLATQVENGYTIATWNGLRLLDFDILAEESGCLSSAESLAIGHVDMMFHALCELGYGVGLDAAARGWGLPESPRA